jgi:hypothetical protein
VRIEVAARRLVHAGDLHVAPEGDRPDPVLDPVVHPFEERRREENVEAARPHPDRQRREEVPRLVDEDEEGQPTDGDRDAQRSPTEDNATR